MKIDAGVFDRYRPAQKDVLDALAEEIVLFCPVPQTLLDVGCGTGSYSIPLASRFSLRLTGIDASPEMLDQARGKLPDGNWVNQDFMEWNPPTHYDIILMVYVIHLFRDWRAAVNRAVNMLNPNGVLMIVTDDHSDLRRSFVHMYVPRVLEIDLARFPKVEDLLHELDIVRLSTKLRSIVTEREYRTPSDIENAVDAARARYISTLRFLSDDELEVGIGILRSELIAQLSKGTIKRIRERSLIVAKRPRD